MPKFAKNPNSFMKKYSVSEGKHSKVSPKKFFGVMGSMSRRNDNAKSTGATNMTDAMEQGQNREMFDSGIGSGTEMGLISQLKGLFGKLFG
tara:strand:+ start:457 stop:729 length:273 start_codon:yes stop_codon:yes gene_type:complete